MIFLLHPIQWAIDLQILLAMWLFTRRMNQSEINCVSKVADVLIYQADTLTDFRQLFKNRFYTVSVIAALILLFTGIIVLLASLQARPAQNFPFSSQVTTAVPDDVVIQGSARFDKGSYFIGEPASYEISLLWNSEQISPDLETFKNGIGFFPFNREGTSERQQQLGNGLMQYTLHFTLQAVDVIPSSTYQLPPPTVYFEDNENSSGELKAYRIPAPSIHIGSYYPANVSRIPLREYKGGIADPTRLRQGYMFFIGLIFLVIGGGLAWQFGRIRKINSLSEPEKLWRTFQLLQGESHTNREHLIGAELIFTDLLQVCINMSPASFWSGTEPEEQDWKEGVKRGRALFYQSYLETEPGTDLTIQVNELLDSLFAQLVEEERLKTEQVPSFAERLKQQPQIIVSCSVMVFFAVIAFTLALQPGAWRSADLQAYNEVISMREDSEAVERQYEYATGLAERVNDNRIKAAALFNAGIMAAEPGLTGQDDNGQAAILEVMFQEERVFLDALMHSTGMEDPFLLVSIIRDSLRFLTQGEASLKAAVRIAPRDEDIRRNLELIQKRKQAYAKTIQELLQEGEEDSGLGKLQRQSLMDLERFMQMEMPDEYAELEEGKDDKDYFILEGF